ncbi:MAG: NAD(P)-dependent oxidoreductase [Candidatus Acidiferrales bacterium]
MNVSENPHLAVRRDVKYVVLGAAGFVGGALIERLRRHGAQVVPVIHRIGPGAAFLARFEMPQQVADVRNPASLQPIFKDAGTVFHCVTGDRASVVEGLSNSLEAARSAGVRRFVYLSSAVVHGFHPKSPIVEDSPFSPRSASDYAENKVAAEKIIANWRGAPETVVLRPSIIYGPRSKYWSEAPAREIVAGTAYLVDQGAGHMNDIYIEHLLDAMLLAANHPKAANRVYVLQDGFGLTWRDYYRSLCDLLGASFDLIPRFALADIIHDSGKLRRITRWAKATPSVFSLTVRHDPLKSWLKQAPGFESVRRFGLGAPVNGGAKGITGNAPTVAPQLEVGLLHTFPQPIDDARIRGELEFLPRFTFAETLEALRRWYRFVGLAP